MKKKFLTISVALAIILSCACLWCSCFFDDKKDNIPETTQTSTTTINFYIQNGNQLKKSIKIDLSNTYYCEVTVENANFYSTCGYYTEKNGQGITVYDFYNYYTSEFKTFCEGKTSVDVFEY